MAGRPGRAGHRRGGPGRLCPGRLRRGRWPRHGPGGIDLLGSRPRGGKPPAGPRPGAARPARDPHRSSPAVRVVYQLLALADGPHRRHRLHRLLPHQPGPDLQHLLAARLSERHGVSLSQQPDLARSLLCPRGGIWTCGPGSTRGGPSPTNWTVLASRAKRWPASSKGWSDCEPRDNYDPATTMSGPGARRRRRPACAGASWTRSSASW